MDTLVAAADEEEEEEEEIETAELQQSHTPVHRSVHCSLSVLCEWYNTQTKVGPMYHDFFFFFTFAV